MTDKKDINIKVRVLKDKKHTHAGHDYTEGAEFDLSKEQATWLINSKVVEGVK